MLKDSYEPEKKPEADKKVIIQTEMYALIEAIEKLANAISNMGRK